MDRTRIYWATAILPTLTEDAARLLIVNAGGIVQQPEDLPQDWAEVDWRVRLFDITTSGATLEQALSRWPCAARAALQRPRCAACDERRHARRSKNSEAVKPVTPPQLAGGDACPRHLF